MKLGIYIGLFLLVLAGVFTAQNGAVVEVRFLAWKFSMSQAALTFLTFAGGLLAGVLMASALRLRSKVKSATGG